MSVHAVYKITTESHGIVTTELSETFFSTSSHDNVRGRAERFIVSVCSCEQVIQNAIK